MKFSDDKEYRKLCDKVYKKRPKSGKIDFKSVDELALKLAEQHTDMKVRKLRMTAKRYLTKVTRLEAKREVNRIVSSYNTIRETK